MGLVRHELTENFSIKETGKWLNQRQKLSPSKTLKDFMKDSFAELLKFKRITKRGHSIIC